MARRKNPYSMYTSDPRIDEPEEGEVNHNPIEVEKVYSPTLNVPVVPTFGEWVKQEVKPKDQNSLAEYNRLYGKV